MTDDDQAPRGLAIDDAEMPEWARRYFTPEQQRLSRGLQWILLIYKSKRLEASRISVAQRLHVHMEGRERKAWNPSQASLAEDLDLSLTTVGVSLDELEQQGWVLVRERKRTKSWYRLAWPVTDVLAPEGEPEATCGQPTKKGGTCTRKAGRGTTTPGVGPCVLHGGEPRNGPGEPTGTAGDEDPAAPVDPQPLEQNTPPEHSSTPTAEELTSNRWSVDLQPLEHSPPTVGDDYVPCVPGALGDEKSSLLAVGELTVRTAREDSEAPSAKKEDLHSDAGWVLTQLPAEYRNGKPWLNRALLVHASDALANGYGRLAIVAYCRTFAADPRYRDFQHLSHFDDVIRKLAADVAEGAACRGCGRDPGINHPFCEADLPLAAAMEA
ncbi:hypothetical protein AB0O28_19065 [Microbispora sp. NPDC088329]|uniref:hypothetical protein n=1 Tax=Microbispora sp. NPDC088329 TaxID=3154869 RepID=UPI00343B97BF